MHNYRTVKVLKLPENKGNNLFRLRLLPNSPKVDVRFPSQQLEPFLRRVARESRAPEEPEYVWEVDFPFQKVPPGESADLVVESLCPGTFLSHGESLGALKFEVQVATAELAIWVLLPEGWKYRHFQLIRHQTDKPEQVEAVKVVTQYLAGDSSIVAFKLLALKAGYTYEVSWSYDP